MKKEKNNKLPQNSLLNQNNGVYDFMETYYVAIQKNKLGINEILSLFFKSIPKWIMWMFNIKFKMEMTNGSKSGFSEGEMIGPFHIFRIIHDEAILGINAKHMDFRISFLIERKINDRICFSSTITINSFVGKCHIAIVKTIYRITTLRIIRIMAKQF